MSEVCNDPVALALFWMSPHSISAHCDWALSSIVLPSADVSAMGYLRIYLLTNLLEAPFYLWLLREQGIQRGLLGLFAANTLTHPLVYFGFPLLFFHLKFSYGVFLTFAEFFAVAVEITFICRYFKTFAKTTVPALALANIFSWWAGVYI